MLKVIFKTSEVFASEINNASYVRIIKNLVMSFILYYLSYLIFSVIPALVLKDSSSPNWEPTIFNYLFNSLGALLVFAFASIFIFTVLFAIFVLSKILKGQGSFKQLFYLVSIVGPLLAFLVHLYWPLSILLLLYFVTMAVKESQGFSTIKSLIVSILAVGLGFAIYLLLGLILLGLALTGVSGSP